MSANKKLGGCGGGSPNISMEDIFRNNISLLKFFNKYNFKSPNEILEMTEKVFRYSQINSGKKPFEIDTTYNEKEYFALANLCRILQILAKYLDPSYNELFFKTVAKDGCNKLSLVDLSRAIAGFEELTDGTDKYPHRGIILWESKIEEEKLLVVNRFYDAFLFLKFIGGYELKIVYGFRLPPDNLVRDLSALLHESWVPDSKNSKNKGKKVFRDISFLSHEEQKDIWTKENLEKIINLKNKELSKDVRLKCEEAEAVVASLLHHLLHHLLQYKFT